MAIFKAGDVVQLKSGGPQMTVRKCSKSKANCIYFINDEITGVKVEVQTLRIVPAPVADLKAAAV